MIKILFICHGNICRSPLAEFLFRDMAEKHGSGQRFYVESSAVSMEEYGNPVYPPVKRILKARGIDCSGKRARITEKNDYERFDLLICMDESNVSRLLRITGGDPEKKIHLLMKYTGKKRSVADPYYSGDFDACLRDIEDGCQALLKELSDSE